jgi:putative transposase
MPAALKRYSGHDYLHFLTCSCYHRQPGWRARAGVIYSCKSSKKFASATCLWWVGYVVMPDHIHLLISEPERGTPSTVMQVVKQRFARRVLNRQRRNARQAELWPEPPQHVWQKRFYDFHVWSERKRVEKLRYMHRNPVKAGLISIAPIAAPRPLFGFQHLRSR